MTLGKRKGTRNWKRKHSIALSGELALNEAADLSQDRLRGDDGDDDDDILHIHDNRRSYVSCNFFVVEFLY